MSRYTKFAIRKMKRLVYRISSIQNRSSNLAKVDDRDGEYCVNEYGMYYIPSAFGDRIVPKVLQKGEVYEPKTIAFLKNHFGDGDIVTGGAFIGDFLPALSAAAPENARVWTFEPNPVCVEACRRTIAVNRLSNVSLVEKAVGSEPGAVMLRVFDFVKNEPAAAQSSIDLTETTAKPGYVEVQVTTIDELIPDDRSISVIHLDIEGFELEALKGAIRTVNRCKPILILELADKHVDAIKQMFPDVGYEFVGNMERNAFFAPKDRTVK